MKIKKNYLRVEDVMKLMSVGKCKAYQIIRTLNKELDEKGFITISGQVSTKYFYERTGLKGE